ncbi:6394_t:CDS:2 [Paraglomus occultum]|uniref:6394_t:CDS:1 n=1 Tax=Paraglomus occultum TaxID=144539 RepID=A0A9N9BFF7_9GLOM|nr:6394_t:CDS:2 [Paraglomus occultum]
MSETNATSADDEFSTFETAGDAEDDFGEFDDFTDFASGNAVDDKPEIAQEIDSESARKGDETGNAFEESGFNDVLSIADTDNMNNGLSIGETVIDLDEAIASIAKVEPKQILEVNPRSLNIWNKLSPDINETLFQWKHSVIRKSFYSSLGVEINTLIQAKPKYGTRPQSLPSVPPQSSSQLQSSRPHSLAVNSHSTPNTINNHHSKESAATVTIVKEVDVELIRTLCTVNEETLQSYSTTQLHALINQLLSLTKQTSDVLTYWLDQREQTVMDSETYNQMIECLVGHAQMIRDGNQKEVSKTSIFESKLRKCM